MKSPNPGLANETLLVDKVGGLTLPDFKTYIKLQKWHSMGLLENGSQINETEQKAWKHSHKNAVN